jgi:hypothetical protein
MDAPGFDCLGGELLPDRRAPAGGRCAPAGAPPRDAVRPTPGSDTWAVLRREAERRFAAGEPSRPAIDELQELAAGSGANPPSRRTMMRW